MHKQCMLFLFSGWRGKTQRGIKKACMSTGFAYIPINVYMNLCAKKIIHVLLTVILSGTLHEVWAQRGLPSEQHYTAEVNTFYPQHEEFKESMVSRLTVPAGFSVSVVATGLGKPRMMALAADGSIYITRRDQGDVILLSDKDGDGRFEDLKTVMTQFKGVHGIVIHDGYMYLCADKELKRARIKQDGMLEDTVTLFKNLPDGGQHGNRVVAFGPDGMMYISVGSDCNDCGETNAEHATMLQVKPDGSTRKIYARGLRNTVCFDWHPQTKQLWGADNGTDWRGDSIPPEELNMIVEGGDYGWPLVFGKQQVDPTREDPMGTTKAAYAKTTRPAVMTFPAHSAPVGFTFLSKATGFPKEWSGDALVGWHGSWNREHPEGFKIQRIHFENGNPVSVQGFFHRLFKQGWQKPFWPAGGHRGFRKKFCICIR